MKTVNVILSKELNDVFNSIVEITNGEVVDLTKVLKHENIRHVKGISGILVELKNHGLIVTGRKGLEVIATPGKVVKKAQTPQPTTKEKAQAVVDERLGKEYAKNPVKAEPRKDLVEKYGINPKANKTPVELPEGVKGRAAKKAIKEAKEPVTPTPKKGSAPEFEIKTPATDPKKDIKPIPGTGKIQSEKPNKSNTPKAKPEETPKKTKFTRYDAFGIVLKRMMSQNTAEKDGKVLIRTTNLAEQSDDVYYNNGGKLNIKESKWAVNTALATLIGLGVVEKINPELISVMPRFIKAF